MLRRSICQQDCAVSHLQPVKVVHYSISTEDASPTREDIASSKNLKRGNEKSQLCKKFIETGYCPYQKRCKFAHGSHELRKNSQANSKYKTKQCGAFDYDGSCSYGNRCNFIHRSLNPQSGVIEDLEFRILMKEPKQASRLMALLGGI